MADKWAVVWVCGSAAFWAGLLFLGLAGRRAPGPGQKKLYSVGDVVRDPNGALLWVLDTGINKTQEGKIVRMAPPRVFAFSRETGEVVREISLQGLSKAWSGEEELLVEQTESGCTWIYVVEGNGTALVLWDVEKGEGVRAVLPRPLRAPPHLGASLGGLGNMAAVFLFCPSFLLRLPTKALRAKEPKPFQLLGPPPPFLRLVGSSFPSRNLLFRSSLDGSLLLWNVSTNFNISNLVPVPTKPRKSHTTKIKISKLGVF